MWPTLKPSQRVCVAAAIPPQSATTVQSTAWVSMANFETAMGLVLVGAITGSGTVDAKLMQAQDSSGTNAKIVTDLLGNNKAITEIVGSANGSVECLINVRADELDTNNGFTYVQLVITPAVAASLISGALLGFDPHYGTADGHAATSQTQIV